MSGDTSLTLGKQIKKKLNTIAKSDKVSEAAVVRDLINSAHERRTPDEIIGLLYFDYRNPGYIACEVCGTSYGPAAPSGSIMLAVYKSGRVGIIDRGCAAKYINSDTVK